MSVKIIGKDELIKKRNIANIYPKEYTNRRLIKKFTSYVTNNAFEKSYEQDIVGYIGERYNGDDKNSLYIKEPSNSRQISQLIPVVKTKNSEYEEDNTIYNFLAEMSNEGSLVYDQNKLLSNQYLSWCPPINVDMFLNYSNYYWVPSLVEPKDNGKTDIVYAPTIKLSGLGEYSIEEILNKEQVSFKDIIVKKYIKNDIKNVYNWEAEEVESFTLKNGMRIIFEDLIEDEYNNIPYMIVGCGKSINLQEDRIYDNIKNDTIEYYTIERGSYDNNEWSMTNRWIHKDALEEANKGYLRLLNEYQGKRPILCYNKDIELYNYGTFGRGIVDVATQMDFVDINGKKMDTIENQTVFNGMKILLLNMKEDDNSLYKVKLTPKGYIKLEVIDNGQDGSKTKNGDTVLVRYGNKDDNGNYQPKSYYYSKENDAWISGQEKKYSNQHPLFNLYDIDSQPLSYYESSEFKGSKLFDYLDVEDETVSLDKVLKRRLDKDSFGNYQFDNIIYSQDIYYTPYKQARQLIKGYKFYKELGTNRFLNDWHLTTKENIQYIKTQFEIKSDEYINDNKCHLSLAYTPDETEDKKSVIVKKNGEVINDDITIEENIITVENVEKGDTFDILFYKKDVQNFLVDGYEYEQPLSIKLNQNNENISKIGYNNCLDHMMSIIDNQKDISGISYGSNNYYTIKNDISLGNLIVQHITPIIKSMILNNMEETKVLNAIQYVREQYREFKYKYINLVKSLIKSNSCCYTVDELKENINLTIEDITNIINQINVGKEGLKPFYNNGMTSYNYIPSSPSFIGLTNVYEPRMEEFIDGTTDETPMVVVCHDGSLFKCTNTQLDYYVLKLEQMIYDSITNFSKDNQPSFKKQKYVPGRFRTTDYSIDDYKTIYNQFLERWVVENKIDIEKNPQFDYTPTENPAWKTWNYSGLLMENGLIAEGSYRAIYMYYYDTYRPDTHPWEMLGFGDKPSWWEDHYGSYPYSSDNSMWNDIEDGKIIDGEEKGEYEYLKRKDLVEKYLPVDENGKLLAPYQIGIVEKPLLGTAVKSWKLGDLGSYEFNYLLSSDYRFNEEMVLYLMKPTHWVETNWNTVNRKVLFKNTDYEQVINIRTSERPNDNDIIVHNEYINGEYVRYYGLQQWISDYLTSNNMSIETYLGDRLRYSDVNLGYRCAGYYQVNTIKLDTDTYGEIPSDNYSLSVFKSKLNDVFTYSAMVIEKTSNGYILDGFDATDPYFVVKVPEYNGRKNGVEVNNQSYTYYNVWRNEYKKVPYRTVYRKIQDLYTDIIGYGKALEDMGWSFMSLSADGEVLDFNKSGKSYLTWATTSETNNVLMLNPGVLGMRIYHNGTLDDMSISVNGQASILNLNNRPVKMDNVDIFRQSFVTEIKAKDENFAMIKAKMVEYEHLLLIDNKTIYGDVIYEPLYANILNRIKLYGVKSSSWDGTLYAPGFLVANEGALPNLEKQVNDLQHIFDTGNVKIKGDNEKLSKYTVGYVEKKHEREIFKNDISMFDFYKGYIREKGTKAILNKLNRSSRLSSNGESIDLYEKWAFKEGEYGYTSDNSTEEFILDQTKITQNPQIITFETAISNYYDETKEYKYGDVVVYKSYEYKCIVNDTTIGEFNISEWEAIRYIGNYLISWDDENWIKKQSNQMSNHFRFTDDYKTLPIGGFPMTTDVDYIVATEDEANELKETMVIGQTVWVVKKNNDDWDVLKKVGQNKFVSMRYSSLEELNNQPVYDNVYEVTDNKKTYYVNASKEQAELIKNTLPIYSDIDLTDKVGVYADLHEPEKGNVIGDYIEGTNYKLKLYNTVFTTLQPNGTMTNNSFVVASDDQIYTYSVLNMKFSDTSNQEKKYSSTFNLIVNTHISKCKLSINGVDIERETESVTETTSDNTVKKFRRAIFIINALEGDTLNYKVLGNGCETIEGSVTIGSDNIIRTVDLHYAEGATLYTTTNDINDEIIELVYHGIYEIEVMAPGGGASSGAEWKEHRKLSNWGKSKKTKYVDGAGGGAGAYFKAQFVVGDADKMQITDTELQYMLKAGIGGKGGIRTGGTSNMGYPGISTELYDNTGKKYLVIEGGIGGASTRDGSFTQTIPELAIENGEIVEKSIARAWGNGGKIYKSTLFDNSIKGSVEKHDGPSGSGISGGRQIFDGSTKSGNGGNASTIDGENGYNGFITVKFIQYLTQPGTGEMDKVSPSEDYVLLGSTNLEYTDVYNKFINEEKPFYCYDAPFHSEERPHANIINENTAFYYNRSKSIKGTLNDDIIMSLYDVARNYVKGDLMTVVDSSATGKYTNYICIEDVSGSEALTKLNECFEIYNPTLYYKIDTEDYYAWNIVNVSSDNIPEYIENNSYNIGSVYRINNVAYVAKENISGKNKSEAIDKSCKLATFDAFDDTKEYNIFDTFTYNGKKYKATSSFTGQTNIEANATVVYDITYTIKRAPKAKLNNVNDDPDMTYMIPSKYESDDQTYTQDDYKADIKRNEDYVYTFNDRVDPDTMTNILYNHNDIEDTNPVLYTFRKNTIDAKDNAGTPKGIKNNYRLYYDSECSNPVIQQLNRRYLTYKDINENNRVIGDKYILVDKIGTLGQLKPQYINEPYWGTITICGSYSITSGNINYYTMESKETITEDTILYSDYRCTNDSSIYQIGSDNINVWNPKKEYDLGDKIKVENNISDMELNNSGYRSYYYIAINKGKNIQFDKNKQWLPFIKGGSILKNNNIDYTISSYSSTKSYNVGYIILNDGSIEGYSTTDYKYWMAINFNRNINKSEWLNYWKPISTNIDIRPLTYGDLTNTVSNKIGISYKWNDENIELWTSTKYDDIETLDKDNLYKKYEQKMYYDEGLTDYAGLFKDFCPQWTIKDFTPNMYTNTYKICDGNTYVWKNGNAELIDLYCDNKKFVPMSGSSIAQDKDGYMNIFYNNDGYGHINDDYHKYVVLKKKDGSSLSQERIFTKIIENTSNYYVKDYITDDALTLENSIDGKTGKDIKLYYNKQAEGNYISYSNILINKTINEEITFIFNDKSENDYVTEWFFKEIDKFGNESLSDIELKDDEEADDIINYICLTAESKNEFISKDELYALWKQYRTYKEEQIGENPFSKNEITHICESYDYHTVDNNGNEIYYNLYKLGNKFYNYETVTNDNISYAITKLFGTIDELTYLVHRKFYAWTYTKNNELCVIFTKTRDVKIGSDTYYYDNEHDAYNYSIKTSIYEIINNNQINITDSEQHYIATYDETYTVTSGEEIVNSIMYKELDDKFYINSDSYTNRNIINNTVLNILSDNNGVGLKEDALMSGKKQWMKVKYTNNDYKYDLLAIQTKRIASSDIKSAYLIDNNTDLTISNVNVYDPIQLIIPNDILDEINYISNIDPVLDYQDLGNVWNEPKLGELWWDISKVRYIDYYQGDLDYRKINWGKQLPGSEIVINEWTKSVTEPTDIDNYIKKETYNEKTDSFEITYYYWRKNPREIPSLDNRTKSALQISKIIDNPTDEGIIWLAPIKCNTLGDMKNSFIIANTRDVINGQEAVLQVNMDSDKEVQDHTEWAIIRENHDDEIPSFIWEKMRDSLLGYKETENGNLIVPDPKLTGNNRYGISFRPRQTMFKNNYEARRNFIECVNSIFNSRDNESPMLDINSSLVNVVDNIPSIDRYVDVAETYLEMINWNDEGFIGENILVESDENHNDRWAIYHMNGLNDFTLVDYQKYNIKDYIEYKDWYSTDIIKAIKPKLIVENITDVDVSVLNVNDIVRVEVDDMWYIYIKENGVLNKIAQKGMLLNIKSSIYDWMETDVDNEKLYIDYTKSKSLQAYTKYQEGSVIKVDDRYYRNDKEEDVKILPLVWESGVEYRLNSKVLYNGIIYECIANNVTTSKFVETEWKTKWKEVFNLTEYQYKYEEMNILMKNIFDYFE